MDTQGSTSSLTVAVIGCGKMGLNHVKAIQACTLGRLVAVADPGGDRAKLQPLLPDGVKWFASATELLEVAKPDVVHIATPPSSHGDLAKACLQHGAHVYVEKPFTLEAAEASSVLDAAQRAGRSVCAGHQLLFEGPALALADAMHLIAKIVHVESYFSFRPVRKSRDGRTLMSPIDQLLDILPHPVYTLLHVLRSREPNAPLEIAALEVRAEGEVHALLRAGETTGALVVTLRGRPIESYLRVVGTNGGLRADFVRGALTRLPGAGTSAIAIVSNPYREATQIVVGSTRGFAGRILGKQKGYPGLTELIEAFYQSIQQGKPSPLSPSSILETVTICERVGQLLRAADAERESRAAIDLTERERALPALDPSKGTVLVTGGSGMLGRAVVAEVRRHGWSVRAMSRNVPPPSAREAGVEYVSADLSEPIDKAFFSGVSTVVHCAAETAGGKDAHDRNTVEATRNLLRSAAAAGATRFLHVSSIAVLKTSKAVGGPVNESTPVDAGNLSRGPYVWAKAEAEREVTDRGPALGLNVRVLRPGPLVDFEAYAPPGRLGRELGPLFLAIGPRSGRLSLCSVSTMAKIIRIGIDDFEALPPVLNVVEPEAPTRAELLALWLKARPDLSTFWMPAWVLAVLSPVATAAQRVLRPRAVPVSLAAAFSSETYDTTLAAGVLQRVRSREGRAKDERSQ